MNRLFLLVSLVLLGMSIQMPTANATEGAVKPGDFITAENANRVKDLVSPGVYYKVERGMMMKIVPTQRLDWPPPYKEATERYSSQVRLSSDHRSLVGYVAGQPFPLLDSNDPEVGVKIVWNNAFGPILRDDYDLRFFDCETAYENPGKSLSRMIDHTQVGHYAGYSLVGRTEVEPLPIDPDFTSSGRYWLFALYPVLAPAEARGTGIIRYRYADPNRGDDTWARLAGTRRVRRLNESIMSTATGAQSWDPDHYGGFNPKTEEYDYKFLGEREMLASTHAEHTPEIRCETDGGTSACPENWELRHLYVVEATPRSGHVNALDGRTVIYTDMEAGGSPYIDTYDRKGQLFRNHIYWAVNRDRPVPDARIAVYPFKREFIVGAVSTEVQSGLSTMCYLPGHDTPEHECWYINMGAVNKDFFTTQAMVRAAQ